MTDSQTIARLKADPIAFIERVLKDPETGQPFTLYEQQKTFLREGLQRPSEGRMRFTELLFSAPKKSGKTTFAGMAVIYTAVALAPLGGEIYILANDLEQSTSRVFKAVTMILEASPLLKHAVTITNQKVTFKSTGVTISALANDYRGFSGANPTLNVYDESAYYTSEGSRRLWDEGIPSPARKISFRLSVSTSGFEGEDSPLRTLYDRATEKGQELSEDLRADKNLLCFWSNRCVAPWQSEEWIEEMRGTLRPAQCQRLIENKWVSSESTFIDLVDWDECVDETVLPIPGDKSLTVWAGLDVGLRHDASALVCVCWDGPKARLVSHRIFVPKQGETLDIESTSEAAIMDIFRRFHLKACLYDPWQGIGLAQKLTKLGVPMIEYPQTTGNLSVMAGTLLSLVQERRLRMYSSPELRQAVTKAVALESSRGWRIAKSKQSERIDCIVSLAMAVTGMLQRKGSLADKMKITEWDGTPYGREDLPSFVVGHTGSGWNRVLN